MRHWSAVVGALAVVVACAGSSREPAKPAADPIGNRAVPEDEEPVADAPVAEESKTGYTCVPYIMLLLLEPYAGTTSAMPGAHAIATAHYSTAEKARAAGDYRGGAIAYLDCARAYRSVPDSDPERATAQENAANCYYNAIYSFASAGVFESEGRAALQREAKADPRLAAEINRELASPPYDCVP